MVEVADFAAVFMSHEAVSQEVGRVRSLSSEYASEGVEQNRESSEH